MEWRAANSGSVGLFEERGLEEACQPRVNRQEPKPPLGTAVVSGKASRDAALTRFGL